MVGAALDRSEPSPRFASKGIHKKSGANNLRVESTINVSYVPPTSVVKLLQYSGLGSNTGMGFHPTNDLHQCLKMVRLLFGFVDLVKNSGGCLFTG